MIVRKLTRRVRLGRLGLQDPRDVSGGGGGDGIPRSVADCNALVASTFDGATGGPFGDGDSLPPDILFANLRKGCLQTLQARQAAAAGTSPAATASSPPTIVLFGAGALLILLLTGGRRRTY